MTGPSQTISLNFALQVEDGWPPVATESLPFEVCDLSYKLLAAPLFIKELSVGDRIQVTNEVQGLVYEWHHVAKSENSTVWFLRIGKVEIEPLLLPIQKIGCNTTWSSQLGAGAIEVPESVSAEAIDECLEAFRNSKLAVAFPSWRHTDA